jgi:hypothetical protein
MKILTIALLMCALAFGMRPPEDPIEREAWHAKMWLRIQELSNSNDPQESIKGLGEYVLKLGSGLPYRSAEELKAFNLAKSELLSIPGHAVYFADPIHESYKSYRDPSLPRQPGVRWYADEVRYGMETLRHLPSPETVKVLGEMLWEEWQDDITDLDGDMTYQEAMAVSAVRTLGDLPLRDTPTPPFKGIEAKGKLPAWQKWYESVKSGEIAFSFKGQSVEYHFKPDGTWETIQIANPPDDGTVDGDPLPDETRPEKKVPAEGIVADGKNPALKWYMIGGLAVILAVGAALFTRLKRGK